MTFKLTSAAFQPGEKIPRKFTAEGAEISPGLRWSGAPDTAREYALLCEDPDAPLPESFLHWMIYGISANISEIPEGLPTEGELYYPLRALQGLNSKLKFGFTGPLPPFFHGPHRYFFRLFALNAPVNLSAGASRAEFVAELAGKVIAEAQLVGKYARSPAGRAKVVLKIASAVAGIAGVGYYLNRKWRAGSRAQEASHHPR